MTKNNYHTNWKIQSERGNRFGIRFLIFIHKYFGASACKAITAPAVVYFYLTDQEKRKNLFMFYKNLQAYQVEKKQSIIKSRPLINMLNFSFSVIDRLTLWTERFETNRVRPHNSEVLYDFAETGRGGLIFSSHLGNFDLCRALGKKRFISKVHALVDTSNAKKINEMMQLLNKDFLTDIIEIDEIDIALAISLKEKIDNGEFIVIAADRVNTLSESNQHAINLPFLGKKAPFPTGPYVLAKVLACPVFSIFCMQGKGGKYDVFFHRLFDQVSFDRRHRDSGITKYAEKYVQQLTNYCQQYPTQWYNFYDFWRL